MGRSRRRFTWHEQARREWFGATTRKPIVHALLAERIERLTVSGQCRAASLAVGRIRISQAHGFYTDGCPPVRRRTRVSIVYLERRDGGGLGGLLWHVDDEVDPSNGAVTVGPDLPADLVTLAQSRLDEMPGW